MRFLSPNSPYISALGGLDLERSLLSVDAEKKTCVFMQMFHDRLQVTRRAQTSSLTLPSLSLALIYRTLTLTFAYHSQLSEMAGNALFEYTNMYNVEWRFDEKKIGKLSIYCALPRFAPFIPPRSSVRTELTHYSYAL